ncbi:MAG TPA: LysE family translocator [Alcanivoracaceae bacterium]|nr:LysE family translocator [Alcanivoracaceae bacterium]
MVTWALISYVVVLSITPGPNNLLLAASGVNYGLRRSLPMGIGIIVGGGIQCFVTLLLFSQLFTYLQFVRLPIAVVGCIYLLWLAWRLYSASAPNSNTSSGKPMTFMQAALFQWVNPKAWIMMINMAALFMPQEGSLLFGSLIIGLTNSISSYPSVLVWSVLGDRLRLALQNPQYLHYFNVVMSSSLALTALWLLWDEARIVWYSFAA